MSSSFSSSSFIPDIPGGITSNNSSISSISSNSQSSFLSNIFDRADQLTLQENKLEDKFKELTNKIKLTLERKDAQKILEKTEGKLHLILSRAKQFNSEPPDTLLVSAFDVPFTSNKSFQEYCERVSSQFHFKSFQFTQRLKTGMIEFCDFCVCDCRITTTIDADGHASFQANMCPYAKSFIESYTNPDKRPLEQDVKDFMMCWNFRNQDTVASAIRTNPVVIRICFGATFTFEKKVSSSVSLVVERYGGTGKFTWSQISALIAILSETMGTKSKCFFPYVYSPWKGDDGVVIEEDLETQTIYPSQNHAVVADFLLLPKNMIDSGMKIYVD